MVVNEESLVFWTQWWTKEATWRHHFQPWEIARRIFHNVFDILKAKQFNRIIQFIDYENIDAALHYPVDAIFREE